MGCQVVTTGRKFKLPPGHKLLYSVEVTGEGYFVDDTKIMLDYVADEQGTDYVLVKKKRSVGDRWGEGKKWSISSIKDRSAANLANYARRLGVKEPSGAVLASLIEHKYKQIPQRSAAA